jgi:hypothetical protein
VRRREEINEMAAVAVKALRVLHVITAALLPSETASHRKILPEGSGDKLGEK